MDEFAPIALLRELAPLPALMIELLAVSEDGLTQTHLVTATQDHPDRPRGNWTIKSMRKALDPAESSGLVYFDGRLRLVDDATEPIIRRLLHTGQYEDRVSVVMKLEPLPPPPTWARLDRTRSDLLKRDLRRAMYAGDSRALAELTERAPYIDLATMVTEPFEWQVIDALDPPLHAEILRWLCSWRRQTMPPAAGLTARIEAAAETSKDSSLWAMLCAEAMFEGDLVTARRALPHLTGRSAQDTVGLFHLATGNVRAAEKAYADWLAYQRSMRLNNDYLPHTLPAALLPVAYLLRGTATRRKQALRLLALQNQLAWQVTSGLIDGWQTLRPLLDTDSPSFHQPEPDAHPVSLLIESLSARWTDTAQPSTARLNNAIESARRTGYHWLADELVAASQGEVTPRGDLIPIVSHRESQPKWSRVLEAIEAQAPTTKVGKRVKRQDRVVWRLSTQPLTLAALVQKPRKDGWTDGRKVADQRVSAGLSDVACATNQDRRIASQLHIVTTLGWARYHDRWFEWQEGVWAELIDADNVVDDRTGSPVTIVRRTPRLVVKATAAGQKLTIEPPFRQGVRTSQVGEHGFEVTTFDRKQQALASLLGDGLVVPTAAQDRVDALVQRLAGTIDVTADSEQTGEQAGDVRPVVRLYRLGEGLSCRVLVRPAGGDGPALEAGRGAELVLARTETGSLRIRRDLVAERSARDSALTRLPALDSAEWTGEGWALPALVDALELLDQLESLRDQLRIEWAKGDPLRLQAPKAGGFNVVIDSVEDWFEARGQLTVDEDQVLQLSQLLRLLPGRTGRFIELGDKGFLALSNDFVHRLEELERAGRVKGQGLQLHRLAAPLLEALVDDADTAEVTEDWRNQLDRMARPPADADLPIGLEAELRPYQLDGYRWLCRLSAWGAGACLADDMGLGKTVQTLALLLSRASRGPALVVAPTSVCAGWREQSWRFTPDLVVYDLRRGDRQKTLDSLMPGDIVVCSYGLLVSELERLAPIEWSTLVLDESQAIKNPQTQRHKAARALRADFRLSLSGTPVENKLDELWAQMALLNPGLLGSMAHFRTRFARPIAEGDRDAMRQLRKLVRPVILRRTKAEVLDDLPAKTIIDVPVELEGEEATVYETLRRQAQEGTAGLEGDQRFAMLAWLTKLRLAACHPRLALDTAQTKTSAKLRALAEIVENLREGHHRALIFSQFTSHLDLVQDWLVEAGFEFQRLDGSTPAIERERRVAAFQQGEGLVFLISLRAGGFGLNLTAADYVVHLDPWWNPAVETQASDRAHRIGQARPVTVYRLYAQGTVEERILELQHDKRQVAEALMEGADAAAGLSGEELRTVLLGE